LDKTRCHLEHGLSLKLTGHVARFCCSLPCDAMRGGPVCHHRTLPKRHGGWIYLGKAVLQAAKLHHC
jgi:hypothetical protein